MALLKHDGAASELTALIGAGTEFEGKLGFEGTVRIGGKLTGSITHGDMLIVDEGAQITADIACGSVVVCGGEVTGNIRATVSVELRQQAKVRGDIETPSLMIERGVLLQGQVRMATATAEAGPTRKASPAASTAGAGAPPPLPPLAAVNG